MAINFPTTPTNNALQIVTPGKIVYVAKTTPTPTKWRDMKGRADKLNRFVNPSFQISQINGLTDGVSSGVWVGDEWCVFYTTSTGSFSMKLLEMQTPGGSGRRVRVAVVAADTSMAAGEWLTLEQEIEGTKIADLNWGTSAARPVVIRFGFKGPAGTYSVSLRNNALDRSYVTTFVISAGQANTDTLQVFFIPGPTAGTFTRDYQRGLIFDIIMASANTTSTLNTWTNTNTAAANTQTNGMAVVGNTFEFFDMGFYADPNYTACPPDFEVPDWTHELQRCQRYIAPVFGTRGIVSTAGVSTRMGTSLPVPMRVVPTIYIKGSIRIYDATATAAVASVGAVYNTKTHVNFDINHEALLTPGRTAVQYYTSFWHFFYAAALM